MRALQRTLAIVASLFLVVQSARHAYCLWLQPRTSVLDKYDQPLKDEISVAASLDQLLRRYEPVRAEVDRVKAERRAIDPKARPEQDAEAEPFKSERALRDAIGSWEEKAKEMHALRFYWSIGALLAMVGVMSYLRLNRWVGMTLLITGFAEIVYWTSPTFLGATTIEFDRLLLNKLVLSIVSVAGLAFAIQRLKVFDETSAAV